MASIKAAYGGAVLKSVLEAGATITSGYTGTITITCPANSLVRLTALGALNSSSTSAGNCTVNVGGRDVFTKAINGFGAGGAQSLGSVGRAEGSFMEFVQGGLQEDITLTFSVATTADIRYEYEVLQSD